MVRPKEFENLATTTVKVPRDLLDLAKDMGFNISELARRALKERIESIEKKI